MVAGCATMMHVPVPEWLTLLQVDIPLAGIPGNLNPVQKWD